MSSNLAKLPIIMKRIYSQPNIRAFRLSTDTLMLTLSVKSTRDSEDSDRSKSFWGPTLFDEEDADDDVPVP